MKIGHLYDMLEAKGNGRYGTKHQHQSLIISIAYLEKGNGIRVYSKKFIHQIARTNDARYLNYKRNESGKEKNERIDLGME